MPLFQELLPLYFNFEKVEPFLYGTVYESGTDEVASMIDFSNITNKKTSNKFDDTSLHSIRIYVTNDDSRGSFYIDNQSYTKDAGYIISGISNSNAINAKYVRRNKLFTLLYFSSKALIFLIDKHDKTLFKLSRSGGASGVVSHPLKCALPITMMVTKPLQSEMYVYIVNKLQTKTEGNDYYHIGTWPYGNVYADGHVCMGSTDINHLIDYKNYILKDSKDSSKSIIDLDLMMEMCYMSFFESVFNHDLSTIDLNTLAEAYTKAHSYKISTM